MAVTKHYPHPVSVIGRIVRQALPKSETTAKPTPKTSALQALTLAALALPGLAPSLSHAAEDNEVSFQYGHYQEGKRNLYGALNNKNPIEADSLFGRAKVSLTDRIKFAFNYTQDTWSGATPVTTGPLAINGNINYLADTADGNTIVAGASPYLNTFGLVDKNYVPIKRDTNGSIVGQDTRAVHVLSLASPETRKQGDFKLGYEWDETAIGIGAGVSVENDYESRFGNLSARFDFNQKLTTLNVGLSYTNSDTSAILDPDSWPYLVKDTYAGQIQNTGNGLNILNGNREDWTPTLSLSQVLSKNALVETSLAYTVSSGYLENPYKATTIVFADPNQTGRYLNAVGRAFMEQRPDERNQLLLGGRYVQHIDGLDAALHLGYRFFHDDWGIDAHTFEADWVQAIGKTWTVTPRVRYYSQEGADFYHPYLISKQNFLSRDPSQLPDNFSSDHRLSPFGALSGGVTVSKQFSKGIGIEAGFEYYSHAGSLKLGGGGEGAYSDFDFFAANAALKVNLEALNSPSFHDGNGMGQHSGHAGHHHHSQAPAGVMFDHMLNQPGGLMLGYRYMFSSQGGDMLHGANAATDTSVVSGGCGQDYADGCQLAPLYMDMGMHMLDIMYAPTAWLNLMLMPQFMDMDMNLRKLDGAPPPKGHVHTGTGHATGGIGDTGMYALVKLFDHNSHHVHIGLGLSAPTADVDIKLRRTAKRDEGFIHYGMQLGSGTWDFKPSLTYTGKSDAFAWGAQVSGTKRLENKNESGFAFGDIFQATAWGGYDLNRWFSTTLRGVYTEQGAVSGQFKPTPGVIKHQLVDNVNPLSGSMDYPHNYGGRYWDVGFGLNFTIPDGELAGNRLGFEWLQPIATDVNGYQLDREGGFSASWSLAF